MTEDKNEQSDHLGKLIIVMGVSGCGKSTVGEALAKSLSSSSHYTVPFLDGDSLHPQTNVDKMSRGEPLTDHDRDPWLTLIREKAVELMSEEEVPSTATGSPPKIVVIACSALKRIYRDVIRGHHPSTISRSASIRTYFVFIDGPREVLLKRMSGRKGHFMKVGMLDSQLDTLERPNEGDEERIVVVSLEASVEEQVRRAIEELNEAGLKY